MLQACRVLSPLRSCVWELPRSINMRPPNPITRTFSTLNFTHYQKAGTVTLPAQEATKKSRKKKKTTSEVTALDASGYQELKARVVRLRAKEIDSLQGTNLTVSVLNANTCENCGNSFKNIKQLKTHLVSCEIYKPHNSAEKVGTSSLATEYEETRIEQSNEIFNKQLMEEAMEELAQIENEMSASSFENEEESVLNKHSETNENDDELFEMAEEVIKPTKKKKSKPKVSPDRDEVVPVFFIEERLPILIAQFDTFISNNKVEEAYEYFKKLHEDPQSKPFVERIEILDLLLRGFARRCEFSKIQEIWSLMTALQIKPTQNSYISVIQSFSNANPKKNVFRSIFNEVLKDLTHRGFTVDEALAVGIFDFDDRAQFIQSLNMFTKQNDVSLERSYSYNNTLVSSLNDKDISKFKSPVERILTKSKLKELAEYQINSELSRFITIPSICEAPTETTLLVRSHRDKLESKWRAKVTKVLKQRKKERGYVPLLGKTLNLNSFIYSIPIKNLVDIIISTAQKLAEDSETYSPSSHQLALQLGSDLMTSYHLHCKTVLDTTYAEQFKASYDRYLEWFCDPKIGAKTARETFENTTEHYQIIKNEVEWPYLVKVAVGRELMSLLLKEVLIQNNAKGELVVDDGKKSGENPITNSPAFFKVFRPRKDNKDTEEIKPHPSLAQAFSTNKMVDLRFSYEELPMVTPPLPWLDTSTGGYLFRSDSLVKIPPGAVSEQEERIKNLSPGTLNPVLDSLNLLGSVPWRINKDILKVAVGIFADGSDNSLLCDAGLPIHPDKIPPPVLSPEIKELLAEKKKPVESQLREYQDYLAKKAIHNQIKSESYSLWCNTLYQLSVANHFQDNVVWFPHNMDFRGRVYPIPPYLNHMGNDLCRSILVFAKGKPLGKSGFEWLKLHTVNLTGVKKRESVPERMVWFEEILPEILDSANNPVNGNRWWLESDEPWQTLSACCEIRNALNHPSGPEKYVCHLPIHQDGSCNGLQHYSALGRDQLGAASVNLVPADKPQDVYSEIAAIVERKRREDAAAGLEVAKVCDGFVRRKVVKQTVMTTVYGVTKYGATKQIARQLKDIDEFPTHMVDQGSKYLANKTFESLNEMFTSSQEIQEWFTECAKVISGDCKSNVEWVTPLGFPVVQPYSKSTDRTPKIAGHLFKVSRSQQPENGDTKDTIKVNGMKHRNGFAPNFIHSLDSCHMMLTALHLWPQGVTYASVHDCYWTHASDVEKMNKVCRDQFVALHSHPILEELSDLFNNKFLGGGVGKDMENDLGKKEATKREKALIDVKKREILFSNVPSKGNLDLQVVRDSVYFFS